MLCCTLLLFCGCSNDKAQEVNSNTAELKFNLFADSTYRYTVKNNTIIKQKQDDKSTLTINQNMTMMTSFEITAAQSGQKNVSVTYERITMSTGNELLSLDYDSENDDGSDPFYEDLRNLIDKNFTMVVADNGKILSSEPVLAIDEKNPGRYNYSDSSIRKVMSHFLYVYPEGSAKVGDIWERNYTTSAGFANIRVKNKYQLASIKNGIAHIELQGIVSSSNTRQAGNSNVSLKGKQSGSLDIAVHSGQVVNGKIKQSISGSMDITGEYSPVDMESNVYILGITKKENSPVQ